MFCDDLSVLKINDPMIKNSTFFALLQENLYMIKLITKMDIDAAVTVASDIQER